MATRRSSYVFRTEEDFQEAKDHLFREMYSDYYNNFYFSGGRDKIEIWSDCSDPIKAASIIKEHGGKYYDE